MTPTHVRYAADGWGVGEFWLDGGRLLSHIHPAAKPRVRVSGPVEGVWGNREVPAEARSPSNTVLLGSGHPLAARFSAYFAGEPVEFDDVEVALEDETPFGCALAETLRRIPRGEVVTYGELAALAGRPGAARAAGSFCARNRLAIVVPCHRVVAADGLGAYGSLGLDYKRRLLALEGARRVAL